MEEFTNLCKENKIEEARRLFNNCLGTDDQIEIETLSFLFLTSCSNLQIGIARMLFNISLNINQPMYIYVNFIDLFERCYCSDNFQIAKWIYYIGKIYNIDYNIDKHKKNLLLMDSSYRLRLDFLYSLY